MANSESADVVVVGAGTVGGWASVFARANGAKRVIVLERAKAGDGASSRAAGVVRSQGGTPETVALGRWSIDFYRSQRSKYGTDSGFRELGYMILAVTAKEERDGRERVRMQQRTGLAVSWLEPAAVRESNPTLATDGYRGASFAPIDGCIDPPRNVRAYSLAMQRARVELREGTAFEGLRLARSRGGRMRVTGVQTSAGTISTERVILTGGPVLRELGRAVGARLFVGSARHQVAITEPDPSFEVERLPMVFDVHTGLYWRLEEGGLLWGMSNPDERPGASREIDWHHLSKMRRRLERLVPVVRGLGIRKVWAATIEYTPDHLPMLGPIIRTDRVELEGTTVACACGHGMMWGPAVARCAADLATKGKTSVTEVSDFGMDRFDEQGRSPHYDPVALPFPVSAD
jgi:sarcosine oxidase subunit beta